MKNKNSSLINHFQSSLNKGDIENLKAYHSFYQKIEPELNEWLEKELEDHPVFGEVLRKQSVKEREEQRKQSRELQYDAIFNNNWLAYTEHLSKQGTAYAGMGVAFYMWYDVVNMARQYLMQELLKSGKKGINNNEAVIKGMNRFFDFAMCVIGEAYLEESKELLKSRETTIMQQARDILELSTPVIQIWEGIVLVPLIGVLDSERTYNLKEVLLHKIVDTESPVAVIDITGVPTIDTQTAQYLIETIKGVDFLGSEVVLTGVRPSISQTLVTLGISLPNITTCSSLSKGLKIALKKIDMKVEALN